MRTAWSRCRRRKRFAWCSTGSTTNGGTNRPLNGGAYPIPIVVVGATPLIRDSLVSPNSLEYAGGVSRRLGEPGHRPGRSDLPDLPRFLRLANRPHDRHRDRQAGPTIRPHADREHRSAQTALRGAEHTGHLPRRTVAQSGRDLHVIAHVGELRRRRGQRADSRRQPAVSGVQASRLELSGRGSVDRPASSRADLGHLRRTGSLRSAGQRPPDAGNRRPLRGRGDRRAWIRGCT